MLYKLASTFGQCILFYPFNHQSILAISTGHQKVFAQEELTYDFLYHAS
jgi:hypothetical protein